VQHLGRGPIRLELECLRYAEVLEEVEKMREMSKESASIRMADVNSDTRSDD
jgi:hypothetical protein